MILIPEIGNRLSSDLPRCRTVVPGFQVGSFGCSCFSLTRLTCQALLHIRDITVLVLAVSELASPSSCRSFGQ